LLEHSDRAINAASCRTTYLFSALDKQCKVQLMIEAAAANGLKKTLIDDEDAQFTANTIQ